MELEENSLANFIPATIDARADLAREITDEVVAQLPEEKKRLERELVRTGRATARRESHRVEGLGQEIASYPPIAYLRWNLLLPGCWNDRDFRDEFLRDNPACCLNGYKPKAKPIYFDMGAKSAMPRGAQLYHALKKQIGLPDNQRPVRAGIL